MKPFSKNDLEIIKKNFVGKHTDEEKNSSKSKLINEETVK